MAENIVGTPLKRAMTFMKYIITQEAVRYI